VSDLAADSPLSRKVSLALLHEGMLDKRGDLVTTSLTMLDLHDLSRSASTFGVQNFFVIHPSPALRQLAATLEAHWKDGYGSTYNPDRKQALSILKVLPTFDQMIEHIEITSGHSPVLIATSAKRGEDRISFQNLQDQIDQDDRHYIILLGTGWGMGDELLAKASHILEPVLGAGDYNHLSVRSAGAIILDRLMGRTQNGVQR